MKNKGSFLGVVEFIPTMVMFGITAIIILLIIFSFNARIQDQPNATIDSSVKEISEDNYNKLFAIDVVFAVMLFIFIGGSVLYVRRDADVVHPTFIVVVMLVLLGLGFLAWIFETFWKTFASNSTVASMVNNFTFMPFILDHFVICVLVYIGVVGVSWLTKEQGGTSL